MINAWAIGFNVSVMIKNLVMNGQKMHIWFSFMTTSIKCIVSLLLSLPDRVVSLRDKQAKTHSCCQQDLKLVTMGPVVHYLD